MTTLPRKARLEDIAKHAGVGLATVDRVLNERGGVSERTMARVLTARASLAPNAFCQLATGDSFRSKRCSRAMRQPIPSA